MKKTDYRIETISNFDNYRIGHVRLLMIDLCGGRHHNNVIRQKHKMILKTKTD